MRVILFGATGMIGSGVLLECLDDPRIVSVVSVVRRSVGIEHTKLHELIRDDFFEYTSIDAGFADADACFYCLGVSSAGMREEDYRRVTYDFTLAAANAILAKSPNVTFCFVSGVGTDASGRGRVMWARVKGQTENALRAMPFAAAYMFRPGFIQPLKGVRSRTTLYQAFYNVVGPLFPLLRSIAPNHVTTTVDLARAMIEAARSGYTRSVIDMPDINRLARQYEAGRSTTA